MTRKNQLINLKLLLDNAIDILDDKDKQVIFIKTRLSPSISTFCEILDLKERTAFRRIDRAFSNLTIALNESKYVEKLIKIMKDEMWIVSIRDDIKERRMSYKVKSCTI